jgi:hypothetical protein
VREWGEKKSIKFILGAFCLCKEWLVYFSRAVLICLKA